mgnify:CR=1 FL=1|tara:strand:- start:139 stop:342 length:204 start_codon:yes stop_codon:yes gene_type:complete
MIENNQSCSNCGHNSHCGVTYSVEDEDGFTGETYMREICKHCRCSSCEVDIEAETKYDLNEDLFNGA